MQIQLFNDSGFLDPVNVEPADFSFINLGTSSAHSYTVDDIVYKGWKGTPLNSQFALVSDTQKIAFYRGEGQPYSFLDNHTFYIKPNMRVVVTFKVVPDGASTRLNYSLFYYVGSRELIGFNDGRISTPAPSVALYVGNFRHNDEKTLGFYLRTADNVIQYTDVSMNYWDGSYRPRTKSQTPTVSPNGHYGTGKTTPGNMTFSGAPAAWSHVNATEHGLRVYTVYDYNMELLYRRLWSKDVWQRFTNSRYSPISGILAYHRLPIIVPTATSVQEITICGQDYQIGNDENRLGVASAGIIPIDAGSAEIQEVAGSFLDYAPYCSAVLHLPYIGNMPIDINKISGGSIEVRYWIDVCSGNCMAHVRTTDRDGSSIIYGEYAGNCAYKYPVTGNDQGGTAVLGAAAGAATAGLVALVGGGAAGITASKAAAGVLGAAGGLAQAELNSDHHLQQSGSWPANTGTLCDPNVYLIVTRPAYLTPDNYPEIVGYPAGTGHTVQSFIDAGGGILAGEIHADGIDGATDAERDAIESAFRGGVFV